VAINYTGTGLRALPSSRPFWAIDSLTAGAGAAAGSYIGDQSIITKALDFAVADCPLSDSEARLPPLTAITLLLWCCACCGNPDLFFFFFFKIAALPFSVLQIPITLGALEFAYNIPGK